MKITRLTLLILVPAVLATGCAEDLIPVPTGQTGPIGEVEAGLVAFQNCGDLEQYVKDVAASEIEKGFGYLESGQGLPGDVAVMSSRDSDGASGENSPTSAAQGDGEPPADPNSDGGNTGKDTGPSFSGTNNQTQGVDEADLVKTDGHWIYSASGTTLRILRALPAKDAEIVSEIKLAGGATELFLHEDTLLVYGYAWGSKDWSWFDGDDSISVNFGGSTSEGGTPSPGVPAEVDVDPDGEDMGAGDDETDETEPEPASKPGAELESNELDNLRGSLMLMTVIDISDRTKPDVIRTIVVESNLVSARMIGSRVYTVARGQLFLGGDWGSVGYAVSGGSSVTTVDVASPPPSIPASDGSDDEPAPSTDPEPEPASKPSGDDEEYASQLADLKLQMLEKLNGETLDDWMPKMVDLKDGNTTAVSLADCGNFYKPTLQMGLGTVSVIMIDLADPLGEASVTTTLGRAGTVYASKNAIYVAAYVYEYWMYDDETDKGPAESTHVHRFDISGDAPVYTGSGKVPGRILNQFAMSEHNGHLRVATTVVDWSDGFGETSGVSILDTDGALDIVGKVDGLAQGERIYAVRFIGDRGYVVTFEQIDPLFTLDLSDPTAPTVGGELKIPGFSTYIHPLGDNHLLTIGREVEDNGNWQQITGVSVQIFDVTDISAPKLAHKAVFGDGGTSSEALYDHKAFSFFAEQGLLALPYSSYGGVSGVSGGGGGVAVPTDTPPDEPSDGGSSGSGSSGSGDSGTPVDPTEDTDDVPTEDPNTEDPTEEPEGDSEEPEWEQPKPTAGVVLFHVDAALGLSEFGKISHDDLLEDQGENWYWFRDFRVRRTLMIEDNLYTIGTAGMKVNTSTESLEELASVSFPVEDDNDGKLLPPPPNSPGAQPVPAPDEDEGGQSDDPDDAP